MTGRGDRSSAISVGQGAPTSPHAEGRGRSFPTEDGPAAGRILLVCDTPQTRSALSLLLTDDGFQVEAVRAADDVVGVVQERRPALILLHGAGPGADPLATLARIRQEREEPVIVLSWQATPEDRVRGLELGADDYLATPFDPDELTARVRAVLRRSERHRSAVPPMVIGDLTIDFERRILSRDGTVVPLGRTEWLVLRHLARYPGKVVLNTELLSAIWGDGYADDLQVLRICISRLRQKLGATRRGGGPIRTFHNVGYALEVE